MPGSLRTVVPSAIDAGSALEIAGRPGYSTLVPGALLNRTTVVFLALAILLAHTLAIHQTSDGRFAAPYERAHVAYRIGRNLAFEGRASWDVASTTSAPYPSTPWVWVGALAVQIDVPPTLLSQVLGILCALGTLVVMAQFSPNRLVGLVAPVLIATSGSVCAAAASGTEAPLAMLLVATAFLAFERGWRALFLVALCLLLLARPEGALLALGFLALELADRPRDKDGRKRRSLVAAYAVALLVALVGAGLRRLQSGSFLSPSLAELLEPGSGARATLGLHYAWSFFVASGSGALIVLPVLALVLGTLPATGRRALVLFAMWTLVVVISGGDGAPFWNLLVPALPVHFLATQAAISAWIDRRPNLAPLAWALLGTTMAATLLVSKVPGNFGPLPIESWLRAWMTPDAALARVFDRPLGRLGLMTEIREVERLRSAGIFLRDQVSAEATIGTFWPGAVGYLSHKQVVDLLGRTQPAPAGNERRAGGRPERPWEGDARVDLVAVLSTPLDYLVLEARAAEAFDPTQAIRGWLERYDLIGVGPGRIHALRSRLGRYELVAVPVPLRSTRPEIPSPQPFLLLREKRLALGPRLELVRDGRAVKILAHHRGHAQVVDLELTLRDEAGITYNMRPTGEWVPANSIDARVDLLLYDTGPSSILLARAELPLPLEGMTLTARLHTPGIVPEADLATVGIATLGPLR
jgi:hypothetical protein